MVESMDLLDPAHGAFKVTRSCHHRHAKVRHVECENSCYPRELQMGSVFDMPREFGQPIECIPSASALDRGRTHPHGQFSFILTTIPGNENSVD